MHISDAAFKSWMQGDLTRVEQLLTEEIASTPNPFHHARALAYRALVRSRSRQWDTAIQDAEKVFLVHPLSHVVLIIVHQSIMVQQSVVGHIAHAVALLGNGDDESALLGFDRAIGEGLPSEKHILSLIKVQSCHSRLC